MEKLISRVLFAFAATVTVAGTQPAASIVFGQQRKPGTEPQDYPTFFKVYSKDGRESLTATCTPVKLHPSVDQVTCKFVHVRFVPPQPDETNVPLSVDEALKADPTLAEEVKEDPKKFEQQLRKGLESAKQDFCSSSSKGRMAIETRMRDPEVGPKRKSYFKQLIAACSSKDPSVLFRRMLDLERRTCGLFVDHFALDLKKVREGQWLYRQEKPGLLSKVLKVYELTNEKGHPFLWTLSETRVPTEGAEEKPSQTVWSWKNLKEYELPCEFISHTSIQAPLP